MKDRFIYVREDCDNMIFIVKHYEKESVYVTELYTRTNTFYPYTFFKKFFKKTTKRFLKINIKFDTFREIFNGEKLWYIYKLKVNGRINIKKGDILCLCNSHSAAEIEIEVRHIEYSNDEVNIVYKVLHKRYPFLYK